MEQGIMRRDFKFIQRLYWQAYNTPKKRQAFLDTFHHHHGCCDEVCLFEVDYCMEDRFVPLSEIRRRVPYIKESVAFFRANGLAKIHINIMNVYGFSRTVLEQKPHR